VGVGVGFFGEGGEEDVEVGCGEADGGVAFVQGAAGGRGAWGLVEMVREDDAGREAY